MVRRASEVVGGPVGEHAAPHPWWTPVRVLLAVAVVAFGLGMLQKTPCVVGQWTGTDQQRYGAMCYSDVPYLYVSRGLAERLLPYADHDGLAQGRYSDVEYPVLTGYFMYAAAVVTQALHGWPDLADRQRVFASEVASLPGVLEEEGLYFQVTTVLLAAFALAAAWMLVRANRGRPWDVAAYVASPCLIVTGLINWDYLAVAAVAAALLLWSRGRPGWAGVAIGLGTATKLYPLFLLGALLAICLRRSAGGRSAGGRSGSGEMGRFWRAVRGAAIAWLAVDLPAMLTGFDHWLHFWTFNSDRGADLGSVWLAWQDVSGRIVSPGAIDAWSLLLFGLACVGVLALVRAAREPARIAQVGFLIVCAFVVTNKVYSPQYVMWLLPLAVLARPRVRDQVVWQSAELLYFAAVWLYLGRFTAPAAGGYDRVYVLAIVVRVAAELWLAGHVVRDVLRPEGDPVRGEDPLWPVSAGVSRPISSTPASAATLDRSPSAQAPA